MTYVNKMPWHELTIRVQEQVSVIKKLHEIWIQIQKIALDSSGGVIINYIYNCFKDQSTKWNNKIHNA